jgi:hypothetical protein
MNDLGNWINHQNMVDSDVHACTYHGAPRERMRFRLVFTNEDADFEKVCLYALLIGASHAANATAAVPLIVPYSSVYEFGASGDGVARGT